MPSADTPNAFAYHVPSNPYDPADDSWATLVRSERLHVGDRLADLSYAETVAGEVVVRGSLDEWEVVAIEVVGDEGHCATIRRKRAGDAFWDGRLVLRIAD